MSERFLIRFNLSCRAAEEERREYLEEFKRIQDERIRRLGEKLGRETELLRGKRVLFLGDSITSDNLGYRTSVSRVAELCATDGSVSGATSADLLPLAKKRIDEMRYDLISVMLGANDSVELIGEERNQVSLDKYAANMEEILGRAKESGASVLLFAITPVHEERFEKSFSDQKKRKSNETVAAYNHRLCEIAEKLEIPLIPHKWLNDGIFLEKDGIHLTSPGQERLSEAWLVAASNIIKS